MLFEQSEVWEDIGFYERNPAGVEGLREDKGRVWGIGFRVIR